MDIAAQRGFQEGARPESRTTAKVLAGGSLAEGVVGAAGLTLAILGLVGILPFWMATIGTIAVGAAFLIEGGAIASRMSDLMETDKTGQFDITEIGGGMTAEFLAGLAGITLGILALLGVSPLLLMAVAVIVYGGALVMGSPTTSRLNYLSATRYGDDTQKMVTREAVGAAATLQLLIGIGTAVLGILAIVDEPRFTFILIGLLAASFAGLVSGSALGSRMLSMFRR
jgi:hypothetical protein